MVRRLLVLTGIAAIVAFLLRRRRAATVWNEPVEAGPDPAEELRRTLDARREREGEDEAGVVPSEPEAARPDEPDSTDDAAARRRAVQERARAAIDEMRRSSPD